MVKARATCQIHALSSAHNVFQAMSCKKGARTHGCPACMGEPHALHVRNGAGAENFITHAWASLARCAGEPCAMDNQLESEEDDKKPRKHHADAVFAGTFSAFCTIAEAGLFKTRAGRSTELSAARPLLARAAG